jgi:NAD(P)-dependent dehydrogenase (short-subunit alcohol dehydrogenase family)
MNYQIEHPELSLFGLWGKTALITGAAQGIGRATARLFSSVGANVVVADIHEEGATALASELSQRGKAIPIHMDVSDEESVVQAFKATTAVFGGVDVLINNAAYRPKSPFLSMTVDQWELMHSVIARGTFLACREAIKVMRVQGRGGAIVNISSVSAVHPTILNNVHYDSAKAGVEGITRALAYEFAAEGIRVNAIRPGKTASEGSVTMRNSGLVSVGSLASNDRIPLGHRAADPAETARAILFFASPAASYITRQALAVDGGFLIG